MCGARELYEETGLSLVKIHKIIPAILRFPDLSDSSAWVVLAQVDGEMSDHTEADEWIEPGFYSKEEVGKLLMEERFSGRAQTGSIFLQYFSVKFFAEIFQKKRGTYGQTEKKIMGNKQIFLGKSREKISRVSGIFTGLAMSLSEHRILLRWNSAGVFRSVLCGFSDYLWEPVGDSSFSDGEGSAYIAAQIRAVE